MNALKTPSDSDSTKTPLYRLSTHSTIMTLFNSRVYRLTRRDMESYWGRFWRYENAYITLIPVDESQPALGGKVKVNTFTMDFRTFTPSLRTLYGVYSDDFITFGEFSKEAGDPLNNEELLLKVCDENDSTTVPVKITYKFDNNNLYYKREVNTELKDIEVEPPVQESQLHPHIDQTWSELFFYGLGNKRV